MSLQLKATLNSFLDLRLKASFSQSTRNHMNNVYEMINPDKCSCYPPEDKYGALELFIPIIDMTKAASAPKFKIKRPSNLIPCELMALTHYRTAGMIS